MANLTGRGPGVTSPGRRSMAAAARAAAKRTATGVVEPEKPRLEAPDDASQGRQPDDQQAGPVLYADGAVAGAEGGAAGGRRRGAVSAVLAVLVVAGLVAVAVFGSAYLDGRQADTARVRALAAARKAAPVVLSYDYRRLEKDFAAARAHLTGSFRDEYRRTTTAVVAPTAKKYQGVVRATVVKPPGGGVPAASVVSASPDRAVVLLFVNQVTRSTQIAGDRVDLNRVRMTLTLTSEGWKVSAVDAL
ncbi:hypothetical protein HRW18_13915 [Streptomyces lunaelactis]|uniref:hypothetical protein n=1 Tax=Streptomyces lunaelactis TaxID=1535768 RepID=UPI0015845551|nr:hypothetical protein [Streptomyces lunaelactis]NUK09082.1 hypothetical protein [Streptomyces lunaelactis]NUK23477.1 hypothetical protein [Streptomyces lunaelactis]NUK35147.1 hypothetical protein [Streptomyces lunaelactis]NUK41748.1 hypothetical protein [Streptomyces lunaelactis]NUK50813.1 hypothetical protein [Streptomyces lunaelactis]